VTPSAAPQRAAAGRQIPALDGIRGIAIIWVVLHNTTAMPFAPASRWLHVLPLLAQPGWIGVQLFFALSGFLITAGLLDSRASPHFFRDFYAKRALRILPLYYTVLFVLLVLLPWLASPPAPFSSAHQAPLWLFTANWAASLPYGFGHFWSLAIEEQFYLVWPLVVLGLAPRGLFRVCLWIAAGALLLRCALVAYGVTPWTLYVNTACRMDALALGGAGACLLRMPKLRDAVRARVDLLGVVALAVFLVGIPLTHLYDRDRVSGETLGYTLLAFSSATFVSWAAMSEARAAAVLAWAPLRSLGKYSYAMYVFHNLIHKLLGEPWLTASFGKEPPLPVIFGYALGVLLVSYLLACLSWHVLEQPFLRLKRRFGPSAQVAGG
jgi:peptidoglycan/LPS O-acetylase OafA/YrhL